MNPTDTPDDDPWSSLADELGVDDAPAASADPLPDAADADADTQLVPELQDGEPEADGDEPAEPGEPGKKKRRRRRRRRGQKPGDESAPAADGDESAETPEADADDDDEPVDAVPAETARETIANWDVPSWEAIVTGLYRPGR